MRHLCWIYWLFWAGLPTLTAYPVSLPFLSDLHHDSTSWQWERYWLRYTIGLLSVTATAFTLAGCLCCQRHRRPKGFQDKRGNCKQEFKNGSTIGQDSTCGHSIDGLELDVPRMIALNDRVQFEPLPIHRVIPEPKISSAPKPLPLSPSSFSEEHDQDSNVVQNPCQEWFNAKELSVPREKLKYLREIGRGWFGKVVEGRADLQTFEGASKHGAVVVRILTEDASNKEKAWFLGEAVPYLRMRHQNVLALLGFCLETDPYLLLFESCPVSDLKGFLLSNHDQKSQEALIKENVPTRMALEILAGLQHMHTHGFAHTDLSARNCLVASDLSAKLGDYGTGVDKYPKDYYVVGDRALPIRWSAPESLECTDTTIETREITLQANIWSYAIFLWEIITWAERPYNNMSDEQVIEMLLALKSNFLPNHMQVLQTYLQNCPSNMIQIIRMCLSLNACKRPSLNIIKQILLNEYSEPEDFEERWENLKTNTSKQPARSASLQDLRGSIDSDYWTSIIDEKLSTTLQSGFRLGPGEPVQNISSIQNAVVSLESSSETEDESWKAQIEQGIYTEKVRQKSKSVTDLMVLVHIDSDSDAECSLGTQIVEKSTRTKFPATNSDSNLSRITLANEFDEALKNLRESFQSDTYNKLKLIDNSDLPKFLTLTMDQGHTPILRLSLDQKENIASDIVEPVINSNVDNVHGETHVLRLLSKGDPNLPLLRYIPDQNTCTKNYSTAYESEENIISNTDNPNLHVPPVTSPTGKIEENKSDFVDVILWNHALDSALNEKIPGFFDENEFTDYINSTNTDAGSTIPDLVVTTVVVSEASLPCIQTNYSAEEKSVKKEDGALQRRGLPNEEDDERKHLSTPDDEQSSDSGFRDKESCEEEEGICAPSNNVSSTNLCIHASPSTEEEQLKVLLELDTMLDAEYYASFPESEKLLDNVTVCNSSEKVYSNPSTHCIQNIIDAKSNESSDPVVISNVTLHAGGKEELQENIQDDEQNEHIGTDNLSRLENQLCNGIKNKINIASPIDDEQSNALTCPNGKITTVDESTSHYAAGEYEHDIEDEDSSTMSLRSDNSYVSFGMEEEFVTAIRNELREKLPHAHMPVVETAELHDDTNSCITNCDDNKLWDEDETEEGLDQGSGGLDIAIRYNLYGTPLSPILEERESTVTSECAISNSHDASIASKDSIPSDDVLLVDTRTNKLILLGSLDNVRLQDDDHDTTNGEISEEENVEGGTSTTVQSTDKLYMRIPSGGAPLPSPEEESKWQQLSPSFPLPLPLPVQSELMSTSFAMEHGWESHDDDEEDEEEEEDEENSSSSGEFVWKRYNEPRVKQIQIRNTLSSNEVTRTTDILQDDRQGEEEDEEEDEEEEDVEEEEGKEKDTIEVEGEAEEEEEEEEGGGGGEEEEEEEEEFTPSAWNATLAPHRSALRSPDKTVKSAEELDQKKSVWFKKQRYHCVYEYPKETLAVNNEGQAITTWEPTAYTDWEEMMDEPRLDLYPLDYDDAAHSRNEEFYVSSSNRPFQFQTSDTKYVSQFFPGASSSGVMTSGEQQNQLNDHTDQCQDSNLFSNDQEHCQHQLGELRHTRNRLKLNLQLSCAAIVPAKQEANDRFEVPKNITSEVLVNTEGTNVEYTLVNAVDNTISPEVPRHTQQDMNINPDAITSIHHDNQEQNENINESSVVTHN